MIWIKLVSGFKFYSGSASTKEYRTTVQNFGLRVKDVIYAVEILDRSSSNAKIGVRHEHGASDNVNLMVTLSTPVVLATATPPTTVMGAVGESTSSILMPHFMPIVLAGSDSGDQWIVANIYVGGKPY